MFSEPAMLYSYIFLHKTKIVLFHNTVHTFSSYPYLLATLSYYTVNTIQIPSMMGSMVNTAHIFKPCCKVDGFSRLNSMGIDRDKCTSSMVVCPAFLMRSSISRMLPVWRTTLRTRCREDMSPPASPALLPSSCHNYHHLEHRRTTAWWAWPAAAVLSRLPGSAWLCHSLLPTYSPHCGTLSSFPLSPSISHSLTHPSPSHSDVRVYVCKRLPLPDCQSLCFTPSPSNHGSVPRRMLSHA